MTLTTAVVFFWRKNKQALDLLFAPALRRRILFTTPDPTNNRHKAKILVKGDRKARAIAAGRP